MKKPHANNPYQQARLNAGLTQEQAIEHLPFELRSLQAYEAGVRQPRFDAACAMARLYGCSADAFAPVPPEEAAKMRKNACTHAARKGGMASVKGPYTTARRRSPARTQHRIYQKIQKIRRPRTPKYVSTAGAFCGTITLGRLRRQHRFCKRRLGR